MPMGQYIFGSGAPITWDAAAAEAGARGGLLASVNDLAEHEFMLAVLARYDRLWTGEPRDTARNGFWIGLTQPAGSPEPSGGWAWQDGTSAGFTAWHAGQPDNFLGDAYGLYWDNDGSIGWADHVADPALAGYGPVESYAIELAARRATLRGGSADEVIYGGDVDNVIRGGLGDDMLHGGGGADELNGGKGRDRFVFDDAAEADGDMITDLTTRDRLDLSDIDAREDREGNQRFTRVDAFTGRAGELTVSFDGVDTMFAGDTDGDGVADFVVTAAWDQRAFEGLVL